MDVVFNSFTLLTILAMKELIRDTAFGKLVRILSGRRLLLYPEERDLELSFMQEPPDVAAKEEVALPDITRDESIIEPNRLETIMSQASYRSHGGSWPVPAPQDKRPIIVGWRPGDSEVLCLSFARIFQGSRD